MCPLGPGRNVGDLDTIRPGTEHSRVGRYPGATWKWAYQYGGFGSVRHSIDDRFVEITPRRRRNYRCRRYCIVSYVQDWALREQV